MPPPIRIQQAIEPPKAPLAKRRRIAGSLLVGALLCSLLASPASAKDPAKNASAARAAAPIVAPKTPVTSPLRPQTRYTVRKQIESIRPTEWLASYGQVQVREVRR